MLSKSWWWLIIAVVILDQVTKQLVTHHLLPGQYYTLLPFLNIALTQNTGIAFSFFDQGYHWQRWILISITLVICLILTIWLVLLPKTNRAQAMAIALILGGAIGNLWDRLYLGYVNDFIDFHWHIATFDWHFATFNLADSAISCGAIILVASYFFSALKIRT